MRLDYNGGCVRIPFEPSVHLAKICCPQNREVREAEGRGGPSQKLLSHLYIISNTFIPTSHSLPHHHHRHLHHRVLEAVVSGRADGSTGPTVSSVLGALVRTGGSGFLIWLFFHGLQQMSTDEYIPFEGRDAATVLPAASFTAAETSEGLVVAGAKGSAGGAFCHALEQSGLLVDVGGRECEARRA